MLLRERRLDGARAILLRVDHASCEVSTWLGIEVFKFTLQFFSFGQGGIHTLGDARRCQSPQLDPLRLVSLEKLFVLLGDLVLAKELACRVIKKGLSLIMAEELAHRVIDEGFFLIRRPRV